MGASLLGMLNSLNTFKRGGGFRGLGKVGGGLGGGGAMPVFVTNMGMGGWGNPGGMPGSYTTTIPGGGTTSPKAPPGKTPGGKGGWLNKIPAAKNLIKAGGWFALFNAITEIPGMIDRYNTIDQDETLTDLEKDEAKGGEIGETAGSIAGGAAGTAAGAALGTALIPIPVVGTLLGGLIGGLFGSWLGGKAGKDVGEGVAGPGKFEKIAQKVMEEKNKQKELAAQKKRDSLEQYMSARAITAGFPALPALPAQGTPGISMSAVPRLDDYGPIKHEMQTALANTSQIIPQAPPPAVVEGEIKLKSELIIDDKGYRLKQQVDTNTTPYKFAIGQAQDVRVT
jgi:hypothetical protein